MLQHLPPTAGDFATPCENFPGLGHHHRPDRRPSRQEGLQCLNQIATTKQTTNGFGMNRTGLHQFSQQAAAGRRRHRILPIFARQEKSAASFLLAEKVQGETNRFRVLGEQGLQVLPQNCLHGRLIARGNLQGIGDHTSEPGAKSGFPEKNSNPSPISLQGLFQLAQGFKTGTLAIELLTAHQ